MIKIGGSVYYIDLKAIDKVIVDDESYTEKESFETEINETFALVPYKKMDTTNENIDDEDIDKGDDINEDDEFKDDEFKDDNIEDEYDPEDGLTLVNRNVNTRILPKSKEFDASKYNIITSMIETLLHVEEDADDMLGTDSVLNKQPIAFKLAFNTLEHYKILKEI